MPAAKVPLRAFGGRVTRGDVLYVWGAFDALWEKIRRDGNGRKYVRIRFCTIFTRELKKIRKKTTGNSKSEKMAPWVSRSEGKGTKSEPRDTKSEPKGNQK